MLKKEDSDKEVALDKSWGGISPKKKSSIDRRNPLCSHTHQRYQEAAAVTTNTLQQFRSLSERWHNIPEKTDNDTYTQYLNLLRKQEKRMERDKQKIKISIIASTAEILPKLQSQKAVLLHHQTVRSELFQLLLGIRMELLQKGDTTELQLYTSESLLPHYLHFLVDDDSAVLNVNSERRDIVCRLTGITIKLYEEEFKHESSGKRTLVFLDTLMCSSDKYLPIYRKLRRQHDKEVSVVVYSDNLTCVPEINSIIELNAKYPVSVVSNCSNWKMQLCKILRDGKLHALRTDAVIFTKDQSIKNDLAEILSQDKLPFKIHSGETKQDLSLSNIFVCEDEEQLSQWNYCYDNVACIYDEGIKTRMYFDYENRTYVQTNRAVSPLEMKRRMACLGRIKSGQYLKGLSGRCRMIEQLNECELSRYVVRMLAFGFEEKDILQGCSELTKVLIGSCLNMLTDSKIVGRDSNNQLQLLNKDVVHHSIRPFLVPIFLDHREPAHILMILSYIIGLLESIGTLHNDSSRKMDKIWMKSGDVSSCVEILSLLQRIIINKGPLAPQISKELEQPAITEGELEMFGFMFEQFKPKPKLTITEMNQSEFIKELDINKTVAYESLKKAADIREEFRIGLVNYEVTEEVIDKVCEILFNSFSSFGFYTGSRMLGYRMSRTKKDLLPAKNSLLVKLNSRPLVILPLKLVETELNKLSILTSNKISDTVFLSINGELPIMNVKSSFGDKQIEFNNVSNALFDMLQRDKGEGINEFEKMHNCMIEANHQTSSILIFCERQSKDRIEKDFKIIMDKYNKDLMFETNLLTLNNLQLVCQKGGSIKQIIRSKEDRCLALTNLPFDTTEIDVKELIEDYAPIEKIEFKPSTEKNAPKTAIITFSYIKDIYDVYNELNFAEYDGHRIKFERLEKAQQRKMVPQTCVVFRWYVWKCNKKGSILFSKADAAARAKEMFDNHDFDGRKVTAALKDRTLELDNLNELTDEIYLRNTLEVYGEIEDIHLDKYTLNEPKNFENLIDFYIKEYTSKDERFHIKSVKKVAQGLRIAKVGMQNPASIPIICSALNDKKNLIGQTRLYVTPYYSHPFLIPKGMNRMFSEFLQDVFVDSPPLKHKIQTREFESAGKTYMIVKSKNQDAFNLIVTMLTQKLKEYSLNLNKDEKIALLTEQGINKLQIVEQRYLCKFLPNAIKKKLSVICKESILKLLQNEVATIALESQIVRLGISAKTARNISKNLQRLKEFKEKFHLQTVHLDNIGKCIILQGKASQLHTARQNMSYFLESLNSTTQQNAFGMQCCQICCEQLNHPYRLQGCGDCFCLDCLMASVNNSFADATTFPIKCPKCREFLIVRDLINLLDEAAWAKLRNISINDFVNKNSDRYMFCFTGNCQGIQPSSVESFECEVCQKGYCAKCKMQLHKGMTCQEAKSSIQVLLKKFMEEQDVRICPNVTCKMLIQRIDGCYRVTCSRCQQSICWKCPRDNMPIYKTADECYKHLTDKHGGYW